VTSEALTARSDPDREIGSLRARTHPVSGLVTVPPPPAVSKHTFVKGEQVRIIAGPFAGLSALQSGMSMRDRELVLIAMLGASRQIAIDRHLIAAREL
jgi:transcription antitermination factor NusG